VTAIKVKL